MTQWSESVSDSVGSNSLQPRGLEPLRILRIRGILQARTLEWVAFPYPGDLLNPGIELASPELQVDSSPSEPPGKPPPDSPAREFIFCMNSCPTQIVFGSMQNRYHARLTFPWSYDLSEELLLWLLSTSMGLFFCDREKVLGWIEEYIIKVGHTQQALNKGQVSL